MAGDAWIDGVDVAADPMAVRRRIGWSGQTPAVDEILSGRQNLVLFGRLNRLSVAAARRRADELLEQFDLADAAGTSRSSTTRAACAGASTWPPR